MNIFNKIISKLLFFEKEPQKVGLSQFKKEKKIEVKKSVSIKQKDIKLSDLMRRAG